MFFCAKPAVAKMSLSSFRFVSAMFTTRNVSRNILSFLLCKSCNRFFASLPKVARSDGIISMSYPLRTAFFCSSIFILSRSVILRLIVLIASLWSILRICILTIIPFSRSRMSESIRSFSSGARISRNDTAPSFRPMRNVRPSPKRNEDGAIKSFVESPDGTSQSQEKRNGSPSGWKIPCSTFKRSCPFMGRAVTPSTLKLFSTSVSIRERRAFAAARLSASMEKVMYLHFSSPLLPFSS